MFLNSEKNVAGNLTSQI